MLRTGLLSIVIGLGLLAALRFPHVGIMSWSLLAFMHPHRLVWGGGVSFSWNMIAAVITLGSWLISNESKTLNKNPATIALCLFALWISITTLMGVNDVISEPLWSRNIKSFLLAFVVMAVMQSENKLRALVTVMVISIGFYILKGAQHLVMTGASTNFTGPIRTTIEDRNELALAMVITVPLIVYLRGVYRHNIIRLGLLGMVAMSVLAVVATNSRGGFLGLLAIGGMYWLRSKYKARLAAALFACMVCVIPFIPSHWTERMSTIEDAGQQDSSFIGRLEAWDAAFQSALDRPFGAGFSGLQDPFFYFKYNPDATSDFARAAHSIYFQVLGDHGFIGLAIYMIFLYLVWKNVRYVCKHAKGMADFQWGYDLARALEISMIGFCVTGAALSMAYYDFFLVLCVIAINTRVLLDRQLAVKTRPRFGLQE